MKKVLYKRLSIVNFLSIGSEPVVVNFTKGIHIITGANKDKTDRKNGVGKSTIADAFYFAHFGESIRDIKKELIVNDVTNGKVEVVLDVDVIDNGVRDSYQIVRNLKPSKLTLYKNGVDITLDSIANTNNFICDTLSLSPSVMINCIVTTVNETIPFMAKSKAEKRKFIEDIFDLDVFGRMLNLLKKEYSEVKKLVDIKSTQVEEIKRTVLLLQENQRKLIDQRNERIAHYEKRKSENIAEKQTLIEEIAKSVPADMKKLEANIAALEAGYKKLEAIVQAQTANITKQLNVSYGYSQDVAKIKAALADGTCIQCLRPVDVHDTECYSSMLADKEAKWNEAKELHKQLEATQNATIEKRNLIWKKLNDVQNQRSNNYKAIEEQKTRTKRLEMIDTWIKELDKDIETARTAQDTFADGIKKEDKRLRDEAQELDNTREHFKVLDSAKFVLGDEGVKTHIVRKLVDLLNSKLTYYIRRLDGNCMCKFNEYFEEEIINNKNKVRSYFNFSGAEKKAVDLAGLFAFSDIKRLQGGVSYNVSIYDELFDSALDETAVNLVIEVLTERVEENDECVMIISHRKEAIKAVTGEVIYLEKRNDITRRVDYSESND